MTEKEKMIKGMYYNAANPRLVIERYKANIICTRYNKKALLEVFTKHKSMRRLLNTTGSFWIKPPFNCDYGYNIHLGKNVFINYGCIFLDVCKIKIGDFTMIGPNTQIYTACHPIKSKERKNGIEFGKPVNIGKNVWIGGGSIILPGVKIGNNSVIGSGSVVTKDIPSNVVAVGNPCKVIKHISS